MIKCQKYTSRPGKKGRGWFWLKTVTADTVGVFECPRRRSSETIFSTAMSLMRCGGSGRFIVRFRLCDSSVFPVTAAFRRENKWTHAQTHTKIHARKHSHAETFANARVQTYCKHKVTHAYENTHAHTHTDYQSTREHTNTHVHIHRLTNTRKSTCTYTFANAYTRTSGSNRAHKCLFRERLNTII